MIRKVKKGCLWMIGILVGLVILAAVVGPPEGNDNGQVGAVEEAPAAMTAATPNNSEVAVPGADGTLLPVTDTPVPTDTPTSTPTPLPTNTPTAAPSPTPAGPVANANANLRSGPGTEYPVVGQVIAGDRLQIVARNKTGDWYQLENGAWIYGSLVDGVEGDRPVAANIPEPPTATPTSPVEDAPSPGGGAPANTLHGVALWILENYSKAEILVLENRGNEPVSISGWRLDGSKGDDACIIPGGTVLQPGETFEVATGESTPRGRGYVCGEKPIWNNSGETIYLRSTDGQVLSIESVRVQP